MFRRRKFCDDAQALEFMGEKVKLIEGDIFNFKITYPEDIKLLKAVSSGRL
jgi:2-C-methyl-D-erythritol 4-phosphate cytidylyltransferase